MSAAASAPAPPLLRVRDLSTHFPVRRGIFQRAVAWVKAVDGVSFDLPRGRTLGLVGESGCGKSTLGRTILRLIPATGGEVAFDGLDLLSLPRAQLAPLRRRMQIVFQDPAGSLNPRLRVETAVGEALAVHGLVRGRAELRARVAELLQFVGLGRDALARFPHEFSGGQRQRICIARALATKPEFIVRDEPVSALDVSIQAQVLNLLADLRDRFALTYLFIGHNLAVVRHFCDDVAVMYLGRIVERAPAARLYSDPRHPYTRALLAAIPEPVPPTDSAAPRRLPTLAGEPPSPLSPPAGCPFHPRCAHAEERCRRETPTLVAHAGLSPGHEVACHRATEI